jgi:hypothetical protein
MHIALAHHLGHRHPHQRVPTGLERQLEGPALHGEHLEAARQIPLRHHQAVKSKALGRRSRPQHSLQLLPVQAMTLLVTGVWGNIYRRARSGWTTTRTKSRWSTSPRNTIRLSRFSSNQGLRASNTSLMALLRASAVAWVNTSTRV